MVSFALVTLLVSPITCSGYDILRDYSGSTFFSGWDFYGGYDNLTLGAFKNIICTLFDQLFAGDVWWLNESQAFAELLAYVNGANRIILKVDNTTDVPFNDKRNSVRSLYL